MKTATKTRDILSNDDIATTCGDAICAASDAEMTFADRAAVAAVESEAYAAKIEASRMTYLAARPAREAAVVAKAPSGSVVCPCCGKAVTVKDGRIVRHGFKGARNGYTSGAMATGMSVRGAQTAACEGAGRWT